MVNYVIVDDQINDPSSKDFVKLVGEELASQASGLFTTGPEFFGSSSVDTCDLALLDYRMDDLDGINVAQSLIALRGPMPILFVSDYAGDVHPRLNLDPRMERNGLYRVVAKPTEFNERWREQVLRPAVASLRSSASKSAVTTPSIASHARKTSILDYSPDDFHALPLEERMLIVADAQHATKGISEAIFGETDAEWLIITAKNYAVVMWGSFEDEEPKDYQIDEIERRFDCPAFLVWRPVRIEEFGGDTGGGGETWSVCGPKAESPAGSDVYPSLGITISGWSTSMHFDTGSVASFVSMESLTESATKVNQRDSRWTTMDLIRGPGRQVTTPAVLRMRLDADVECSSGVRRLQLRMFVVKGWRSCGLARKCSKGKCSTSAAVGDGMFWCGNRHGLLGRDILRLPDVVIVLDGPRKRAYLALDDEQPPGPGNGRDPRRRWGRFGDSGDDGGDRLG